MDLLSGIRVLDLTRLTPGAYGSLLLADLGCDVVKIEEPVAGDYMRELVPAGFATLNRGKRSVSLNLKAEAGRELFLRMVAEADVVFESFRPGVVGRLGIDYAAVQAVRPDIVYCSLSGFGQSGPDRTTSGHDLNYQGVAGFARLLPVVDKVPQPVGIAVGDLATAMCCALSISAAIAARRATGRGQYIDVAITDVLVSWMSRYLAEAEHRAAADLVAETEGRAGYGIFRTSDDAEVSLGCIEDVFWHRFLDLLPADDPLYAMRERSVRDADPVRTNALVAAAMRLRDRATWLELARSADVPIAPVHELHEVRSDPQIVARRLFGGAEQTPGTRSVRFPALFSNAGGQAFGPAPELGEHTEALFAEIGVEPGTIDELRAAGVIR